MVLTIALVFVALSKVFAQSIMPVVTVPRLENKPKIDGVIEESEWSNASILSSFKQLRTLFPADLETKVYLAYDDRNIYLAFRCFTSSGAKLKASVKERDGQVWEDDSVEVFLSPKGDRQYAHIIVNPLGTLYDGLGFDRTFESGAICQARVFEDRWECEIAIPFEGLKTASPKIGTEWRGNFCRNAVMPKSGSFTWSPALLGYHEPHNFGELVFGGISPSVRVEKFEPTKSAEWVKGVILGAKGEVEVKVFKGRNLLSSQKLSLQDGRLPCPQLPKCCLGLHELTYKVTSTSGKVLFAESIFFEIQSPLPVKLKKFFFSKKKVYISLNLKDCKVDEATGAEFALVPKGNEKALWQAKMKANKDGLLLTSFSTAKLAAGEYQLRIALLSESGKVLKRASIPFRKPPTPVWYGNKLVKSDKVPKPWFPVKLQGKIATVWGRNYKFNDLALPESITSGGVELLASPVRLKGISLQPEKTVYIKRINEGVYQFSNNAASSPDLSAKIVTVVEFDGFTRTDLTLIPRKPVKVEQLHLEVPMRREVAMLYWHFVLEGYRWERQDLWPNGGFLPKDGWVGPFTPAFWLGDRERGLQWYAESPKEWKLANRQRAIEVIPQGDAVVLRIRMIDKPTLLNKPTTFTWGLMATPVKPLPANWRKERYSANCGYGAENKFFPTRSQISFPLEGNLQVAEGTLELEVAPLFDTEFEPPSRPELYHQSLVSIVFPDGNSVGFYWNSEIKTLRLYYYEVGGSFPLLFDSHVHLKRGKWHRVGFTWGKKVSIWIDGVEVIGGHNTPLPSESLKEAKLIVGNGQWLVRNLRVSKVVRNIDPKEPLTADDDTTLFVPFDKVVQGQIPVLKGKGVGIVESKAPVIAVEKEGKKSVKLDPYAVRLSFLEYARQYGLRYGHIHEDWSDVQSHIDTIYESKFASLTKACKEAGIGLTVYFSGEFSDRSPLWDDYADEFLAIPVERGKEYHELGAYIRSPRQFVYRGNYATSPYGDFLIWGIVKLIKRYDIGGIYMDGLAYPVMGDNEHTGLGYVTEDGKLYPSFAIFASREFMKRLYIACKSLKPDFYFRSHSSGGPFMPTMSFVSTYFNGEQLGNFRQGYHLPMDRYWAEFYGRNFGFIADVYPTHIVTLFEATCFNILHDVLPPSDWPGNYFPAMAIWQLWDEFEIEKAKFIPFFKNDKAVTSSDEDVKVSYYIGPKGLLLAVANMSPERTITASLRLSRERLLPKGKLSIRKVLGTGSKVSIVKDDTIELTLAPFRWQLIWLQAN